MKNLSSAAVALSLLGTMLPSAFAAAIVVPNEPNHGFTTGENPEWTSAHQASLSSAYNHRQYHRDAENARVNWLNDHRAERGTNAYNIAHRIMVQDRNLMHRLYHMGLEISTVAPPSSSSASSVSSSTSSSSSSTSSSSSSFGIRDTASPSITGTAPYPNQTNISVNDAITATFSEEMYPSTISTSSFALFASTVRVSGNVTLSGRTATFRPTSSLAAHTLYTATITTNVKDAAGNSLSRDVTWNFTTGSATSNANQSAVSLGAASTFGVLAGSTVTNTGPTTVNGDLGVSPGSAVTGFAPGTVNGGAIHATDSMAGEAQAALTVAYNNLAGRSTNPVSVSGNLGGSTLSPGLYKSTSGLEISSGDLTLDAKGDPNAMFVFQIATTLNMSAGRSIVLTGGAKAANVFWQVGTSANLEANSVFKGSILADQSISLQTGANVNGRLLARIGGVTLQSNIVTVPSN